MGLPEKTNMYNRKRKGGTFLLNSMIDKIGKNEIKYLKLENTILKKQVQILKLKNKILKGEIENETTK